MYKVTVFRGGVRLFSDILPGTPKEYAQGCINPESMYAGFRQCGDRTIEMINKPEWRGLQTILQFDTLIH